jgi:peptide methionine sulfoxide reductase MsrB
MLTATWLYYCNVVSRPGKKNIQEKNQDGTKLIVRGSKSHQGHVFNEGENKERSAAQC